MRYQNEYIRKITNEIQEDVKKGIAREIWRIVNELKAKGNIVQKGGMVQKNRQLGVVTNNEGRLLVMEPEIYDQLHTNQKERIDEIITRGMGSRAPIETDNAGHGRDGR